MLIILRGGKCLLHLQQSYSISLALDVWRLENAVDVTSFDGMADILMSI